jgi:hypothetical protein
LPKLPNQTVQPSGVVYPVSSNAFTINATGEVYKGQFYNRQPHGFGEMYTPTTENSNQNAGLDNIKKGNTVAVFDGQAGNGHAQYAQGGAGAGYIKYVGSFKNGQKSGYGRAIYPDGSVYIGDWLNNLPHGKGKLKSLSDNGQDEFYDGDWVAGQMDGLGMQQWRDGTKYQGGFAAG